MASNHKPCDDSDMMPAARPAAADPRTKDWCKSQLERFCSLKDFSVDRRR